MLTLLLVHSALLLPSLRSAAPRMSTTVAASEALRRDLAAIRQLKPTEQSAAVQQRLWEAAGLIPVYKVSGAFTGEPSFTQLFTHETWTRYTGRSPFRRWVRTLAAPPRSTSGITRPS